jgi:hypothetical protein
MYLKKGLLNLIIAGLVLVTIGLFFRLTSLILIEDKNENLNHIPVNASIVIQLNAKKLANQAFINTLKKLDDTELIQLIETAVFKEKVADDKPIGIVPLSNQVLFQIPFQKKEIMGVLLNIEDEAAFLSFLKTKQIPGACKTNVGVIFLSKSQQHFSKLKQLAQTIVTTKTNVPLAKNEAISIRSKKMQIGTMQLNGSADLNVTKNNLLFKGAYRLNSKHHFDFSSIRNLKAKGFHVSTSIIPTAANDSLKSFLFKTFGFKLPAISAISLNYFGSSIISKEDKTWVIPTIDLIIQCEKNVDIQQLMSNKVVLEKIGCTLGDHRVIFDKKVVYFKQLSPTSFYIGRSLSPQLNRTKTTNILSINGQLKPLFNIEGGGILYSLMELIPLYKASKQFVEKNKAIRIELKQVSSNYYKLKGQLEFHQNYLATNELIRFVLLSQLLN